MHRHLTAGFIMLGLSVASTAFGQAPDEAELEALLEQARQLGPGMGDAGQMNGLIEQLGPLQACLEGIDHQALTTLQRESERLRSEVRQLCASGSTDEAQAMAEDYGRRIADSEMLKQLADCTAGLSGLLPSMAALAQQAPQLEGRDVCASR